MIPFSLKIFDLKYDLDSTEGKTNLITIKPGWQDNINSYKNLEVLFS